MAAMKTKLALSKKLQFSKREFSELLSFASLRAKDRCRSLNRPVPEALEVRVFAANRKTRSGRAFVNDFRRSAKPRAQVFLRMGRGYGVHLEQYFGRPDLRRCLLDGDRETLLHLLAHELGHAICGFEGGAVGEGQCEAFAAETVDAWRGVFQPAACLI